jgi:hypothetical protein
MLYDALVSIRNPSIAADARNIVQIATFGETLNVFTPKYRTSNASIDEKAHAAVICI